MEKVGKLSVVKRLNFHGRLDALETQDVIDRMADRLKCVLEILPGSADLDKFERLKGQYHSSKSINGDLGWL